MTNKAHGSPSQGPWDPESLPPALSLGGQATAWECSPGRSLCLTKSSACGRLWQFAQPRPLSSQQKQDWEPTVAQIMNSLLSNSDLG